MTQMKLKPVQQNDLIYFQNLVPGKQNSPFIDRYKNECLNGENDEYRSGLLNKFPPVLSFFEQQKKKFYEDEAKNCQQFCCGGMRVSTDLNGNVDLVKLDNYMVSVGTGKLYEGSSSSIKTQMTNDARQEDFGSTTQNQIIDGVKQFDAIVDERSQNEPALNGNDATKGLSPFKTKPDPFKE